MAELRKQGEHERAEEFRLKVMRRSRRRTLDHLVSSAGTLSDSRPLQIAARYAAGKASTVSPYLIMGGGLATDASPITSVRRRR
ncbi:MAG: hypothetical protein ACJ74F_32760 [Mycobacterium sp.]|uniref:hypothetical protein n=1 Tax=Mycobacterium sp. TaxID=1785 RepID=UPI003899A100